MSGWVELLGGVGLFLFGMAVMTSGLRKLAGDRLRRWLARSTSSPLRGAVTGALATAVVQSSSATTVMAVGFVSAGLMTFTQALLRYFGALISFAAFGLGYAWILIDAQKRGWPDLISDSRVLFTPKYKSA